MGWPRPVGLVFGDGTAAHVTCEDRWERERVGRHAFWPKAIAEEAEITVRREPLP
jgi:hypothetical protein